MPNWLGVHAVALLAFVSGCVLLLGQATPAAQRATFLKEKEQSCESHLATGENYEFQFRTFRWMRNNAEMYTSAVAYYAPSSGEFLWVPVGGVMTKDQYFGFGAEGKFTCDAKFFHFLLLQDNQWVAFAAINGGIRVYHSELRFHSISSGWDYVAEHPEEMSSFSDGRWVEFVSIDEYLGRDFFRPERLRFDARPFTYDPLVAVTKTGSDWQLEVKGADELNRALVYLDRNFKLIKVIRVSAASAPTTP